MSVLWSIGWAWRPEGVWGYGEVRNMGARVGIWGWVELVMTILNLTSWSKQIGIFIIFILLLMGASGRGRGGVG